MLQVAKPERDHMPTGKVSILIPPSRRNQGGEVPQGNSPNQTPLYSTILLRLKGVMKMLLDEGTDTLSIWLAV